MVLARSTSLIHLNQRIKDRKSGFMRLLKRVEITPQLSDRDTFIHIIMLLSSLHTYKKLKIITILEDSENSRILLL